MFKKWIMNLARKWDYEASNYEASNGEKCVDAMPSTRGARGLGHHYEDTGVISFKVLNATGGKIVETSKFNPKTNNEYIERYVIAEGDDFNKSLSSIVTLEYLKQ